MNVQHYPTSDTEQAQLHSATKYFNPSLTASYIYRINFQLQHSKFWM